MKPSTETVQLLDPKTVLISKLNTRQPKKADVAELMETIRHNGQITPAIARPHPTKPGHYELAAGARRKVACEALKIDLKTVVRALSDTELEDMILIDNLQREDPDPMAEARLIERRLASGTAPGEIAAKYGKSETWLKRRMKLTGLTAKARDAWGEGENFSHYSTEMMEYIGTLPPAAQDELAEDTYDTYFTLQELIQAFTRQGHKLDGVEWLHDPASFIAGCGPGCASNDADSLFPDPENTCGTCLNSECFRKRLELIRTAKMADVLAGRQISDFICIRTKGYSDQFTHGGKDHRCLPEWKVREHYTIAKKAGPDTMPGLDVTNMENPAIIHLKLKAGSKDAPTTGSAPGKKESREDKLTAKRLTAMNQLIDNEVTDAPIPAGIPMLRLAAAFGMNTSRLTPSDSAWDSLDSHSDVPGLNYCGGRVTPEQAVWDTIRPILRKRLSFATGKELLEDHRRTEMTRLAALVGMDYPSIWKTICEKEVPIPKSWGPGIDPITMIPREGKTVLHANPKAKKPKAR